MDLPPLQGSAETAVCVVGGGLAGLATALSLAERGIAVTLLEGGAVGDGASGRNGGMASGGFTRGTLELEQRLGRARAASLHAESMLALQLIRQRIQRHTIAAEPVAGVMVASFFTDPAGLREEAALLNERYGMRLEVCHRDWMAAAYATARYTEGLFDPDGLHLDPLALARGYARAALQHGAKIFAASPATGLQRQGTGWRVTTSHGQIEAENVVLCTNVYGDALAPALRRALLPVATYVIVTEPLGDLLRQVIRHPYAVYDDRFAVGYYRPLPDGRLLWGGRVSLIERRRDLAGLMRRDLAYVYPQLAEVGIAAAWSGRMGFARHKMPLLGKLAPGLWMNTAYGGHGLNGTTMGGELIARALTEQDPAIEAFAVFRPQPIFGRLGRLAAQGIYWSMSMKDEVRLRRQAVGRRNWFGISGHGS